MIKFLKKYKITLFVIVIACVVVIFSSGCSKQEESENIDESLNQFDEKPIEMMDDVVPVDGDEGLSDDFDIPIQGDEEEKSQVDEELLKNERDAAIAKAIEIFEQKLADGEDMSSGPCIAEDLAIGWVADVAHEPRQEIDNLPENQCENYRNGIATHFVELDENGEVIKAF